MSESPDDKSRTVQTGGGDPKVGWRSKGVEVSINLNFGRSTEGITGRKYISAWAGKKTESSDCLFHILMLRGLCFPADGPLGSLCMLLCLSLGSNCWNLFFLLFTFSQWPLFILILACSSFISFTLFCFQSLFREVNYCRNASVRLTWLRLDGFERCVAAAET